jgi:hypothetical protein
MVHKATHHFDLVNWSLGIAPRRRRTIYSHRNRSESVIRDGFAGDVDSLLRADSGTR